MAKKIEKKPTEPAEEKQVRLQIILDPELASKIKDDAWRARMSVSEWMRKLAREA
jgi:hypothetical protein